MMPYSRQQITDDDIISVVNALKDDILTGGDKVIQFEKAIGEYVGAKHVIAMNSATSALHVAYLALGVKSGDEVITTPITFAATANAALMAGAEIKFCDVKRDGNIDENAIEALINPRTKVITAVDFGGNPVASDVIAKIAKKHGLKFIDDASHALGSESNGKKIGTVADISIFSFHPVKPLTTLEGGAVVTDDDNIASLARLYRSHGISKTRLWDSDMSLLGYNYRLSDVACALGLSQLKRFDDMIAKRNEIATFYELKFDKNPYFSTIKIPNGSKSSRHLFPILLFRNFWCNKEEIFTELHARGIGVQVHYKPAYKFNYYRQKYGEMALKNADEFYNAELSIPCHQSMSDTDAHFVADTLFEILAKFDKPQCCRV
ncbi:UDP-4-amino-4,6-dideoxy-N-acetyl-beta-L-altrosamine transaminase [Campylobacter sp. faydin G-24]|uniref:UDP-4-amino-4,6-dideoxy-N-acetyl-beta-L-altrosamine transaminase n=1 Tax=Campylobacter anatolicus TaxID=2829105 RepID=A0ABS5HI83_9BACT|nr:UDP-4-amino-4,6-dideoxy-N-acetyl-beta-L-altrosamine transaminase [Campylobacter anatolicus]MBR8463302.1 UDP-4-amino-4,6-dideoxy-N-acetyl-beta-L-altrosamine transaminase [Campylobacter anatolicus]